MTIHINLKQIILLPFLVLLGCQSLKVSEPKTSAKLPNQFTNLQSDTTSSANQSWKQFFADPSLKEIIDTAIKNNYDVLIASQRLNITQADVMAARGAFKPTVNATSFAGVRRFGLYTMDGAGNKTTEIINNELIPTNLPDYNIGIQTSWEADIWGKLKNRRKAAIARFYASVEGKNLVLSNLIAEIANNYYQLLAFDEFSKIITENIAIQERALEIIKAQKQAGLANELAVEQFEAQLLKLKDLKLEVIQQSNEVEIEINRFAGGFPKRISRDSLSYQNRTIQVVKTGIPSSLLANRPDIRMAEYDLLATKADLQVAKTLFYPSFTINAGTGYQAFRPSLLLNTPQSIAGSIFGNLAAPLINKSAIRAEFKRADAAQLEALYNYNKAILNGYSEVYNQIQLLQNIEQRIELQRGIVSILNKSIETSTELFTTGRASYLEVLFAQQNALQSKLELIEIQKHQFQNTVNLYKALGGGWQ